MAIKRTIHEICPKCGERNARIDGVMVVWPLCLCSKAGPVPAPPRAVPIADVIFVPAAERADQWLPIASAPKDGTHFIGYWDGDVHVVYIKDGYCLRPMEGGEWMMPSHWTPLPLPPQEQARG